MSHRSYSSNSGLLPSRPVFGGTDDGKNASSSSLTEQLQLSMENIMNTYLSDCTVQEKAECVNRLSGELSKPLLGHHHHTNRHERISIILNGIVNKSQENIEILSMIRSAPITHLLIKWLKGESLPHGYSGVNTKKAIMMLLPNILYAAYSTLHEDWPLEFVTAYLWDVTYDGHWNDRPECICFTRIIRSILCDIDALNDAYYHFRYKLAAPFVSQSGLIKKEAMFKYDTIKNDEMTKFRLAMELCCYAEMRNEIYNHIERWFNLQNIQPQIQIKFINCMFCTLQPNIFNDNKLFCDKLLRLNYGIHCKNALTKNLRFLFESFPKFYEIAIKFILNIKPSLKSKFQLLLDSIVDATPSHNLDLSQSRRKRKKLHEIDIEWNDSYAITNDEDDDDDDLIKMDHSSYTLGTQMASAREVHSHRKMCDETLKKFINVNKFDLCLFCESYLEHISEKSTTKVKKNGLTYLNNMSKHLIRAQYLLYRECKRDCAEIIEWKLCLMRAQDIITQSFVPLSQHFGFDNVCSLLFNFLLLSIYNGSQQMTSVRVIDFQDVINISEQKKSFQSIPVAMATLDTLFNINVQSMGLQRAQIKQYLCLIQLLLERGLRFVCDYKKNMLYALYSTKQASIKHLLTKAMDVSKYFVPSTKSIPNNNIIIHKYIHKLGDIDLFMEILLIFTLFGCHSLPKYLNVLLSLPSTSQFIHMLILQEWELPITQKQIDIDYEQYEETLNKFLHKDNLTILMFEDRLWNIPKHIITKLAQFEAQFSISKHLWKYYLNNELLINILNKYDYPQIIPSYINHISNDINIIHSQKLNDPILIVYVIFNIVQNQEKHHWSCLFELFRKIRSMFYHSQTPKQALIKSLLKHMTSFNEKMNNYLDFPHLIFSSICQKSVPYIDSNAMKIQLSSNKSQHLNPCKWLFDLPKMDHYLVDVLQCIIELLTDAKYTHRHLNAYITFAAKCITTQTNNVLYKFIVVICQALLDYPLAFVSLLQNNNIDIDIQRIVQYGMKEPNCPTNIIVCMLYIIAYCKSPINQLSSWIDDLKLKIVLDTFTLPQQLRYKLLLKYDNLQLYSFIYRISDMQSLCNIVPFLLDHKSKSAIQMLTWICNDLSNENGRFQQSKDKQLFIKIIKPLIVHGYSKIMSPFKSLFEENVAINNEENVPMLLALFTDITVNDNDDNDDTKDVKMKDEVEMNDELLQYLVAAFDSDKNVDLQEWSKLITKLFCIESKQEKGNIVFALFENLLNPNNNTDYTVPIVNLVNNYTQYMDRLLCYCQVNKETLIRNNIKRFMSNEQPQIVDDKKYKNQVNEWLNTLCNLSKTRKRKWCQIQNNEQFEDLSLLSKLGGFGNQLMQTILKNTNDDCLRYNILSQLILINKRGDATVALGAVKCNQDLHNLFDYNNVSSQQAIEMVVNKMRCIKEDGMRNYEPPKKKPRKLKLILKKSPLNKKKSVSKVQSIGFLNIKKDCYAQFVADKLSDDPALFKMLFKMDASVRDSFIEKCIQFMCDYFYSPIRGTFMVNQLHFTLKEYPHILLNVINVLAKHSKEKLIANDNCNINILKNREDWYFHHFAQLLCCINIENEYNLKSNVIKDLIDSMIVFLQNSPLQIQHLNESVYLTSLLLIKLSKHYFHFFPNPQKMQKLGDRFKSTKMEKMWCLMQSLERFHL